MSNPYEPPKFGVSALAGPPNAARRYSARQWFRAVAVFLVVTPVACAVIVFLLFLIGGLVATLFSSWIDSNSLFWSIAPAAGLAIGLVLGLRTGIKTARDTFPLDDAPNDERLQVWEDPVRQSGTRIQSTS